jgi:uncharacterized phage-associated protein
MLAPFDIEKLVQASAVLLKADPGGRMTRIRLLKLLYIADREMIQKRGRPITGDRAAACDHGPVLSNTYDLIKGITAKPIWSQFVESIGRDVVLRGDPGVGKMTRLEVEKLQEVSTRFASYNDWAVAEYTHTFPEWTKNRPSAGSSNSIPIEDILEATGMSEYKDDLLEEGRNEILHHRISSMSGE